MSYPVLAVFVVCLASVVACAIAVVACWRISRTVRAGHLPTSLASELHEIRDYMTKLDSWSKRLNQRLVMQDRRKTDAADDPVAQGSSVSKDQLRRRAGIIAGRPAPHRNGQE